MICSVIFWLSSDPKFSVSYVDSLFIVVSGITETGLNTVDLSTLTTWQQILLCLLMLCGSAIWVSIGLITVRKHSFGRLVKSTRAAQPNHSGHDCSVTGAEVMMSEKPAPRRNFLINGLKGTGPLFLSESSEESGAPTYTAKPNSLTFLTGKNIGRNGYFLHLTTEEERLVAIVEHDALKLLSLIVPLDFTL
jgi:hypothetical protein